MKHKYDFSVISSGDVEAVLHAQLDRIRLAANITQSDLAARSGVSRSTVARLANANKGISLDSFIRVVQALGLTGRLETLLPDQAVRPLDRIDDAGPPRQRARQSDKKHSPGWVWKDPDNTS